MSAHLAVITYKITCVVPRRMDATVPERPRLPPGERTPINNIT